MTDQVENAVENAVQGAVRSRLPIVAKYGVWLFVVAISIASLLLSGIAWQRSKIDNNTLKSINDITTRLERTAERLDALSNNSNAFNRSQSDYLHNNDRQLQGNYDALSKKFGDFTLTPDDGTNGWLFSQDNRVGSQQPAGDQKPGDSDKWLREQSGSSKG